MTDNTKISRIFILLSEAKESGVKEVDLFDDLESTNYVRLIKFRLNKMLGRNAIVIRNAVWYLDEDYWSVTKSEFRDTMNRYELRELANSNNFMVIGLTTIFAILLIFFTVASYNIGQPDTIDACLVLFDLEAVEIIEN